MCLLTRLAILLSAALLFIAVPAASQVPLFLVDEETTVRRLSFEFDSTRTFEEGELKQQLATAEPGFMDRAKRILPFLKPAVYPFSPLELQRDVARLRLFYQENGFLRARIGYAPSRLDTTKNKIRVIFTIDEGPPVLVQTVSFFGLEGDPFPDDEDESWRTFRQSVGIKPGDRYSEFQRLQTRNETLTWLKNHGFAFAQVRDSVLIDSTALAADLRFTVDPGPLANFDNVLVEGNESVTQQVIIRELPFKPGQRFSDKKLTEGQREVFGLNLFRIALVDLPEQPRDSTASVLVRVREGRPQLVTYRLGYDREAGARLEGDYTHRNFLGAARTLTTTFIANSGFGATPSGGRPPARLFRTTVAVRQPYLFSTKLSGTVAPFLQFERDQQLEASDLPFDINTRIYGLTTTLLYEVLPFRTVSLQHTFSQASLFADPTTTDVTDRFSRSVFSLNGTFGRSDDYLNPTRGVLIRPTLEMAGRFLADGLQYYKASNILSAYTPLLPRTGLAGRVVVGRLWPFGTGENQEDPIIENRFDPVRFYAGGSSDLRGWGDRLAGPKTVRPSVVDGDTLNFFYEPVGGLAKLAANVELRLPFPGLGPNWGTAVFLDAGRVGADDFGFDDFRFGTGAGLRYLTPVGFLRLDFAYKINPDPEDLRDAEAFFREGQNAPAKGLKRFKIHLSIGQTF